MAPQSSSTPVTYDTNDSSSFKTSNPNLWCNPKFSLRRLIMSSSSLNSKSQAESSSDGHERESGNGLGRRSHASHSNFSPSSHIVPLKASNKKPIKSAMRNKNNRNQHPSECIPSGMMGGSILMPSGGQSGQVPSSHGHPQVNGNGNTNMNINVNVNGYISPQWGWYISTTPPTPEYHSSTSKNNQTSNMNMINPQANHGHPNPFVKQPWNPTTAPIQESTTGQSPSSYSYRHAPQQNLRPPPKPVFTKGTPNCSSGWPTVPL